MNLVSFIREQIDDVHELLAETAVDVTYEQAQWKPPGLANPLGSVYAHGILFEDWIINEVLRGRQPMYASDWKDKTGISAPTHSVTPEWARNLRLDLQTMRDYARAVFAATGIYVSSLNEEDLQKELDLSEYGMGRNTVAWILGRFVIGHMDNMIGEISCLKGIQGFRGYPM